MEQENSDNVTVETRWGNLRNVQPQFLGWVILGVVTLYMLWFLTNGMATRLDTMNVNISKQTVLLERLLDHVKGFTSLQRN